MNILKITGQYPPAFRGGGTATAAHALCRTLRGLGHEVRVLTTDIHGDGRLPFHNEWRDIDGVPAYFARSVGGPFPFRSPSLTEELNRQLPTTDVVLLDSCWTAYGPPVGRACRKAGVPYAVYPHGSLAPNRLRKNKTKKALWWRLYERPLYNQADRVVALTEKEVQEVQLAGVRASTQVIANGIHPPPPVSQKDMAIFRENHGLTKDEPIVLFLGRLTPIKGIDILISSWSQIQRATPEAKLVIAGPPDTNYLEKIERWIADYGLEHGVCITGPLSESEKWAAYSTASVFCLPSRDEGFSMAILEALASGTPVVISRECGFPELVVRGAGKEVGLDATSVAEALAIFLEDEHLHNQTAINARRLAEEYDWREIAHQTIEMCESIRLGE